MDLNDILIQSNASNIQVSCYLIMVSRGDRFHEYINKWQSLFHKWKTLPVNTEELECMAWDVMQIFFYIDLSYCKERQSFVIPFTADIRSWLYLI